MCWKKIAGWFNGTPEVPQPPIPEGVKKIALLFAINDYPNANNDLNGCLNDQDDLEAKLIAEFPGFVIRKFKDAEVTRSRFINEVNEAISKLMAGDMLLIHYSGHGTQVYDRHGDEDDGYDEALYLYDGTVIDDDIGNALLSIPEGATVVLMFDSCFSGTVTRANGLQYKDPKYVQLPGTHKRRKKRVPIPLEAMRWIVFSGCGEQQTSADAYFNGKYNGAFTYYALKTLKPGMTYNDWIREIKQYLPSKVYDQSPTLEGKTELFSNRVFI